MVAMSENILSDEARLNIAAAHILITLNEAETSSILRKQLEESYEVSEIWPPLDNVLALLMASDLIHQADNTPGKDYAYLIDRSVDITLNLLKGSLRGLMDDVPGDEEDFAPVNTEEGGDE